jgi:hypothetical protein
MAKRFGSFEELLAFIMLTSIVFLTLVNGGCWSLGNDSRDIATHIKYSIQYKGGGAHLVAMSLINNSGLTANILDGRLPWRHRHAMVLLLVNSDTGAVIEASVPPIDDPVAAVVEVGPGAEVHGELSLLEIYPTLDEDLRSSRVDVFYAFDITCIGGIVPQRVGGWFSIPRKEDGS